MGDPVLSSEGFHASLHHRARLHGPAEARVRQAQLQDHRAQRRSGRHLRHGLAAGGNRIRTIGPALVKGLSAVADERCRTDKLDGVISTGRLARRRWSAAGPLSTAVSFSAGPMVRIHLPPARSQANRRSHGPTSSGRCGATTPLWLVSSRLEAYSSLGKNGDEKPSRRASGSGWMCNRRHYTRTAIQKERIPLETSFLLPLRISIGLKIASYKDFTRARTPDGLVKPGIRRLFRRKTEGHASVFCSLSVTSPESMI